MVCCWGPASGDEVTDKVVHAGYLQLAGKNDDEEATI